MTTLARTASTSAATRTAHDAAAMDSMRSPIPYGEVALRGPSPKADRARTPVRGDLAHIRLAGVCFVPHYAMPIVYRTSVPAKLWPSPRLDIEPLAEVPAGRRLDVLDISGEWAWGQIVEDADDGLVGYIALNALVRA